MKHTFIIGLLLVTAIGCGQDNKRLKEKTRIEGDTLRDVENANLAQKAEKMENDLARRHRFYQAVKGNYEGSITAGGVTYKVRITLNPSLAPIKTPRVRQLDEITQDLNNLMLHTNSQIWDASNPDFAVPCAVSNVIPDLERGVITIAKENCANVYTLTISNRGTNASASSLASMILNGNSYEVDSLEGKIQPATNANKYTFTAYKVQD